MFMFNSVFRFPCKLYLIRSRHARESRAVRYGIFFDSIIVTRPASVRCGYGVSRQFGATVALRGYPALAAAAAPRPAIRPNTVPDTSPVPAA